MKLMPWTSRGTAADAYATAVGRELRDLRREPRRRLITDLRSHLAELPSGSDLATVLGPPQQYADDLRVSRGIAPPRGWGRIRRVRLRVWIAVLFALSTVIVGTVGGIWISRYQPLERGSFSNLPGAEGDRAFGATNVVVDYQQGATYQFNFSLRNSGGVAVDVVHIPLQQLLDFPIVFEEVRLEQPGKYCCAGDAVPFQPFTLNPGEERGLVFRGVLSHCQSFTNGAYSTIESLEVDFRVLGITKSQQVMLPQPIAVRMPGTGTPQCPLPRRPQEGPPNGTGSDTLYVLSGGTALVVQAIAPVPGSGDLARASWTRSTSCSDSPPPGLTAVPVDLIVSRNFGSAGAKNSPVPVDLHFAMDNSANPGAVILAQPESPAHCIRSGPFHIEQLDNGDMYVMHGVAELQTGTCGAQMIKVDANGQSAGDVRLDVACPPGVTPPPLP